MIARRQIDFGPGAVWNGLSMMLIQEGVPAHGVAAHVQEELSMGRDTINGLKHGWIELGLQDLQALASKHGYAVQVSLVPEEQHGQL